MSKHPSRVPCSLMDVKKAEQKARKEAVIFAWAIMFTALSDKFGFGIVRLKRLWDAVNNLSEEISEGRINIDDLINVLRDEYGIGLEDGTTK